MNARPSVLLVLPAPIQSTEWLDRIAADPGIDALVAYCSLSDPALWSHEEHLNKSAFDRSDPRGHRWIAPKNRALRPSLGRFWGLFNPGIVPLVKAADCCIIFGHGYLTMMLAIISCVLLRKPFLLTNDATALDRARPNGVRARLKRAIFPLLYRAIARGVLVPSSRGRDLIISLGVPAAQVILTPYVVDNGRIESRCSSPERSVIRERLKISTDDFVILFCAKLLERKNPLELLRAFSMIDSSHSVLVIIGEGPLREAVARAASTMKGGDRVRLAGLVPYTELPAYYAAADLLVHPASHEPWGLIVNEAMVCGIPVIASSAVGAGDDLILDGETGYRYPSGDAAALAERLAALAADRGRCRSMGLAARARMKLWSPQRNAEAIVAAVHTLLMRDPR